jgi:hypothetical protein|tara:strand:- start:5017 stop:5208 length:192 start_codon:yes stop_codon:yes gene_type:complete
MGFNIGRPAGWKGGEKSRCPTKGCGLVFTHGSKDDNTVHAYVEADQADKLAPGAFKPPLRGAE